MVEKEELMKQVIKCNWVIADELGPFLSKEKATSYLQGRSKRVKRDIDEECGESRGCDHEEVSEHGVRDVVSMIQL